MIENDMTLWYLANAGFLIQVGNQKILVDAVHTRPSIPFSPVPSRLLHAILEGKGFFQGVSCAAFTHLHRDDCELTLLEHLNVPGIQFILPRDPDRPQLSDSLIQRVTLLDGPGGAVWSKRGVTITAIPTVHDRPDRIPPIVHYSYLLEYKEMRALFLGDADVGLSNFLPWISGKKISSVCINFVELNQDRGRRFLREVVRPERIFLCHIPLPQDDVNHFQRMVLRNVERYQQELPPLFPCFESMQSFHIF